MKNAKNLVFFTAITFSILSILFTLTSSAVSINFNTDSSKTMALFSSLIKGDIFSQANAQDDDGGGDDTAELVKVNNIERIENVIAVKYIKFSAFFI